MMLDRVSQKTHETELLNMPPVSQKTSETKPKHTHTYVHETQHGTWYQPTIYTFTVQSESNTEQRMEF